jgi:PAB1-binding protein PBP1
VFFFGAGHSHVKWPVQPQLKHVWPKVAPTVGGVGRRSTGGGGVEPLVLPAGADAEVGGKPTAATDAGDDVAADAGEADRWGNDDTPSDTLREH